ncbi:MAG: hypothetical protein KF847_02360 [Pirellulales bacterium]|nr:hypothetical protein [Pirellulales bacterium]
MRKSSTGERIIAVVSSFVAVAIIGGFVAADRQAQWPKADLRALEADARLQFELAYRHDQTAYESRISALETTVEAYRQSPRSAADQQALAEWFDQAIVLSMPGSSQKLPTTPRFGAETPPAVAEVASTPEVPSEPSPQQEPAPVAAARLVKKPTILAPAAPSAVESVVAIPRRNEASSGDKPTAPSIIASISPPEDLNPADWQPETPQWDVLEEPRPHVAIGGPIPTLAAPADGAATEKPAARAIVVRHLSAASPTPPAPPAEVAVNLAELRARIDGYHAGLREVNAAIVIADERLSLASAARITSELERLAQQHEFVRLYYDALTPAERARVAAPKELRDGVEALAATLQQAAAARESTFDPFTGVETSPFGELIERVRGLAD